MVHFCSAKFVSMQSFRFVIIFIVRQLQDESVLHLTLSSRKTAGKCTIPFEWTQLFCCGIMTTYCMSFKSEEDRRWMSRSQNLWSHRECVSDSAVMIHTHIRNNGMVSMSPYTVPSNTQCKRTVRIVLFFSLLHFHIHELYFGERNVKRAMHMEWSR